MKTVRLLLFLTLSMALEASPPQASTGTVQGTIVRAGSAEPIVDVRVTLVQGVIPTDLPLPLLFTLQQQQGQSAITDAKGAFALKDVPAGRYTLVVQREGFSASSTNTSSLTVTAGSTSEVHLSLVPGAVVRGRVLDAAGRLQSNVMVQAFAIIYVDGMASLQGTVSKATDDRGEFRLFGVVPGEYYIAATPRPPIANTAPTSGTVRSVRTFHPSAITTATASRIIAGSGEEVTGIDIVMQSNLHVRISGKVFSEVAPLPPNTDAPGVFAIIISTGNASANLMLVPRGASTAQDNGSRQMATVLLSAGDFQIQNVVPGSYDLFAVVNTQEGFAVGRTPVDVIDRDIADVTLVVKPGVEVKGTVTIDGKPENTPNASVRLQPLDSLAWITGGLEYRREAGSFSIPSVPEGLYRVTAMVPGNFYVDDVLQNGRSVHDSGIQIQSGTSPDALHVAIRSGAGIVEGICIDAAGRPLASATVVIIPNTRRTNAALYRSSVSDTGGKFSLSGLAPGEYKVFAWPGPTNGAHFNAEFLARFEERGRPVSISEGSRINLEVSALHGEGR